MAEQENPGSIVSGKVLSIIMDSSHPRFIEKGQNKSIGVIEFEQFSPPSQVAGKPPTAQPLFPNLSHLPLKNETVLILKLPGRGSQVNQSKTECFYLPPINIWNTPHVNPLQPTTNVPASKNQIPVSNTDVSLGAYQPPPPTQKGKSTAFTNSLGKYVVERGNIQGILPYAGDVILEGRFGNSLRLGNTINNSPTTDQNGVNWKNTWSSFGENGNPITILRNGQYSSNLPGEGYYIENINKDPSSIWLTSNQSVPMKLTSFNPSSYSKPPHPQSSFVNPQVIINANRVIINAKSDSILLSSQKSVGISSNGSLNFSSKKETIIDTSLLKLGNITAKEPLLRGDITMDYLNELFDSLITLVTPLTGLQSYVENDKVIPTPNILVQEPANEFLDVVRTIKNNMSNEVKSDIVKIP
jgi:hypothetical protein